LKTIEYINFFDGKNFNGNQLAWLDNGKRERIRKWRKCSLDEKMAYWEAMDFEKQHGDVSKLIS